MTIPPTFNPADTVEAPVRLGRLEHWALQQTEFMRQHLDDYEALAKKVNKLTEWRQEIVMAVGAMRLKIGWVMFLVSAISGLLAAIITVVINRIISP